MFQILKRKPVKMDDFADSRKVPVQFGQPGISSIMRPWFSNELEQQAQVLQPHARKQPKPRSGGHAPPTQDADPYHEPVESASVYGDTDPLGVPAPELGRQVNIEQAELRMQLSGVSFVPFPALVKSFRSLSANQVFTLDVPEGAQLVRFTNVAEGALTIWIGRYPFNLPFTTSIGDGVNSQNYLDPICNPASLGWLYVAAIKQLYVGFESAAHACSATFYVTQ